MTKRLNRERIEIYDSLRLKLYGFLLKRKRYKAWRKILTTCMPNVLHPYICTRHEKQPLDGNEQQTDHVRSNRYADEKHWKCLQDIHDDQKSQNIAFLPLIIDTMKLYLSIFNGQDKSVVKQCWQLDYWYSSTQDPTSQNNHSIVNH